MSSVSHPSFIDLWKEYLRAINEQSYPDVKACLSPKVEIWMGGKLLIKDNWDMIEKTYRDHWELPNAVITIDSIEEYDDGVVTKIIDHAKKKLINVKYVFGLEDGKWLHTRHEIGDIVDWSDEETKEND
jgi:hypothetical protein